MLRHNTTTVIVQGVQNDRTIGCLQWCNIADFLYRKMTKDFYWTGVQENIGISSASHRVIVIAWFSFLCLKDQLGLCSLNCHTIQWQEIVLRASEYLLTRCEWFLRREEIRLKDVWSKQIDPIDFDQTSVKLRSAYSLWKNWKKSEVTGLKFPKLGYL